MYDICQGKITKAEAIEALTESFMGCLADLCLPSVASKMSGAKVATKNVLTKFLKKHITDFFDGMLTRFMNHTTFVTKDVSPDQGLQDDEVDDIDDEEEAGTTTIAG